MKYLAILLLLIVPNMQLPGVQYVSEYLHETGVAAQVGGAIKFAFFKGRTPSQMAAKDEMVLIGCQSSELGVSNIFIGKVEGYLGELARLNISNLGIIWGSFDAYALRWHQWPSRPIWDSAQVDGDIDLTRWRLPIIPDVYEAVDRMQPNIVVAAFNREVSADLRLTNLARDANRLDSGISSFAIKTNGDDKSDKASNAQNYLNAVEVHGLFGSIRHADLLTQVSLIMALGLGAIGLIPFGFCRLFLISESNGTDDRYRKRLAGFFLGLTGLGCFGLLSAIILSV